MSRKDLIDKDINEFLANQQGLDNNAKRDLLRNIFQKHIILAESNLEVDYADIISVMGQASSMYSEIPMPIKISGKVLDHNQCVKFVVMDSLVRFLNSKGAFKRLPIFKKEG